MSATSALWLGLMGVHGRRMIICCLVEVFVWLSDCAQKQIMRCSSEAATPNLINIYGRRRSSQEECCHCWPFFSKLPQTSCVRVYWIVPSRNRLVFTERPSPHVAHMHIVWRPGVRETSAVEAAGWRSQLYHSHKLFTLVFRLFSLYVWSADRHYPLSLFHSTFCGLAFHSVCREVRASLVPALNYYNLTSKDNSAPFTPVAQLTKTLTPVLRT